LPNKPRGIPRVNDRRVLNGIFWVLRSGAPWRDLPQSFGPYTTCYNRFVRWRRAGVWARIMSALARGHDAAVQMLDTSIIPAHAGGRDAHRALNDLATQCPGGCHFSRLHPLEQDSSPLIGRNGERLLVRSRGGLTSKIHAVIDTSGLPVRLALPP